MWISKVGGSDENVIRNDWNAKMHCAFCWRYCLERVKGRYTASRNESDFGGSAIHNNRLDNVSQCVAAIDAWMQNSPVRRQPLFTWCNFLHQIGGRAEVSSRPKIDFTRRILIEPE